MANGSLSNLSKSYADLSASLGKRRAYSVEESSILGKIGFKGIMTGIESKNIGALGAEVAGGLETGSNLYNLWKMSGRGVEFEDALLNVGMSLAEKDVRSEWKRIGIDWTAQSGKAKFKAIEDRLKDPVTGDIVEKYKSRRVEQSFWDDLRGKRYTYGEGGPKYSVSDILTGSKYYKAITMVGGYPMIEYIDIGNISTGFGELTDKEEQILGKDFDYE